MPVSRSRALEAGFVVASCLVGLGLLQVFAPDYLSIRGFPLDDAWIHAVYGRELARTGMLAFNPGIPATGATSPLWALLVALPHMAFEALPVRIMGIKLLGFVFHVITVAGVFTLFASAPKGVRLLATAVVGLHPDLIAASVSGMEVSLATALAVGIALSVVRDRPLALGLLCGIAFLSRPELVLFAFSLPVLYATLRRQRETLQLLAGAGTGLVLAAVPLFVRHQIVSGMPLPATFYAKVGAIDMPLHHAVVFGFVRLFSRIALLDAALLLLAAFALALICLSRRLRETEPAPSEIEAFSAAMWLSGAAFCAVSFALVHPLDWSVFYHQRYVLPALPFLVATIPPLAAPYFLTVPCRIRPLVGAGVAVLLVGGLLVGSYHRYVRLDNDAHNVDDMNVRLGMHLGPAGDEQVIWVTDAGAIRYFGGPMVVDLKGLNTPEMLGDGREAYLAEHPPSLLQVMPVWMKIEPELQAQMPALRVFPSTPYTVTSFSSMREMLLAQCPPTLEGTLELLGDQHLDFRCAEDV